MSQSDAVRSDFAYTHHLVALVARSEVAAGRLAAADPARVQALAARARSESALLSARLDASPLEPGTAARVDDLERRGRIPSPAREAAGPPPARPDAGDGGDPRGTASGGWARALKLEGMATQDIAAVEYANLLAAFDAERDLAARLFEDPLGVLRALHTAICRGLVDPGVAGRLRRSEQAVHDGAHGQVIYAPPPPDRLPGLLESMAGWLRHGSARFPPIVVAGVVHERLLEWQPFEAASGRTARAAGRLVLRARGLDPHGVAVPERWLAADPLAYHREVAATIRRRGDLARWLERFGEALCAALEAAAGEVAGPPAVPPPPARAAAVARRLEPGEAVTLRDYAEEAGVALPTARTELESLARAGLVEPDPGSGGLRYRRTA